jgi:hypothetical protein
MRQHFAYGITKLSLSMATLDHTRSEHDVRPTRENGAKGTLSSAAWLPNETAN